MEKKERRICVVDSLYCLFLYFLICGIDENDIFVASERIPLPIRKKLNAIYFPQLNHDFENMSFWPKKKKVISNVSKRFYATLKVRCLIYLKTKNCHVKAYGQGHLDYSFPIYEFEDSYLLEDGFVNYCYDLKEPTFNEDTLKIRLLNFLGYYVLDDSNACLGPHKKIKKVYLTQNNVPEIIKNKTEVIDIQKLWEIKTESEKNKILEIYDIKEIVDNIKDNHLTLLLTQCISEGNLVPLDEEINIYRHLIEKQETNNIIIKTHPRERKNYATFFPEITIMDKPFPLELLKCIGLKIDKIITVASTAAFHFADICEIECYDKKTTSDELNFLIEKFREQLYSK